MSKPNVFVVVDTLVFLKALGDISPFSESLDCIKKVCNRIALSTEILREYECKVKSEGMTSFILTRKIKELERIDKTKGVFRVQIEKAKSTIKKENLPLPADTDDHKFFEAAIACSARYIITTDHSSLDLDPYDHNLMHMRIVKPVQYTAENCQSDLPS